MREGLRPKGFQEKTGAEKVDFVRQRTAIERDPRKQTTYRTLKGSGGENRPSFLRGKKKKKNRKNNNKNSPNKKINLKLSPEIKRFQLELLQPPSGSACQKRLALSKFPSSAARGAADEKLDENPSQSFAQRRAVEESSTFKTGVGVDKEGRDVTSRPSPLPHPTLTTEKSGGVGPFLPALCKGFKRSGDLVQPRGSARIERCHLPAGHRTRSAHPPQQLLWAPSDPARSPRAI